MKVAQPATVLGGQNARRVRETKRRGYLLVASAVVSSDLDATRRMLRDLVLPGQRRLHMKDESDPRKRSIATAIAVSGITATIYDAVVATVPSENDEPYA